MAKSRTVSVGVAATRLDSTTDDNQKNTGWVAYNASAVTVYIGGSDVTTSNGLPLSGTSWSPGVELGWSEALYGIVASVTSDIKVLETGV
mgnify:CR=1 FL=1